MAEEKSHAPDLNHDDIDVLRILLHSIKGLSPISTVSGFASLEDLDDFNAIA